MSKVILEVFSLMGSLNEASDAQLSFVMEEVDAKNVIKKTKEFNNSGDYKIVYSKIDENVTSFEDVYKEIMEYCSDEEEYYEEDDTIEE